MEEEQEAIDKIVNKVMKSNDYTYSKNRINDMFREIAKEALNEGFLAGHELGYDEGYSIGFCEGAGTDALS
jgi:flagellar biosynthesis/type III secretory pathway protein FliH